MKQRKCKCGNTIPVNRYSTIQPKKCPACTYADLYKKQSQPKKQKTRFKGKIRSEKSKAMETADKWFSRYIRLRYHFKIATDGTVLNRCIITGTVKPANQMDNGHCFSRAFLTTRYEEDNCRPQNRSSNRFSGEADHYKFIDNLTAEIGEERFNRIDKLRRETGTDTTEFYKEQSEKYRKSTNKLIKELGAKKWW